MNPLVEEMQTYYGRRSLVYDQSMGYNRPETVDRLAPVIDLLQSLMREKRVLEIACGPCFWTNMISETAASILATDFNESTLQQARQKPLHWDKISLQRADAYALGTVQRGFDGAYAVDWLSHVPRSRLPEFLRSLHETLAPGARVVFCDQLPRTSDQLPRSASLTGVYDEEGNHIQERSLPDGSVYRVIKNFLSDDEIITIFSPYTDPVEIVRFPQCGRIVVSYRCRGEQAAGAGTDECGS
jgi:ubiquinone/menaquinone biosynthesis C-methylase UbiE